MQEDNTQEACSEAIRQNFVSDDRLVAHLMRTSHERIERALRDIRDEQVGWDAIAWHVNVEVDLGSSLYARIPFVVEHRGHLGALGTGGAVPLGEGIERALWLSARDTDDPVALRQRIWVELVQPLGQFAQAS